MKVLITGGAGFIGSHLVDKLIADDYEVKVLDNLHTGDLQNLEEHRENPEFQFLKGDVRNKKDVKEAIRGVDAVFHEAAITSVPASVKEPELTREVNIKGTRNLLEESLSSEVKRFVFASTCAIYGEPDSFPINEKSKPKPDSPYAESKLEAEKKILQSTKEGLDSVILRYFNVYGPRQGEGSYAGVISKFLNRLENDKNPIIYGDGEQTRDFVYVSDVIRANILALKKENVSGEIFNIGSGKEISINKLCNVILELTENKERKPIYKDSWPGDIERSWADLGKVSKMMGYEPEVSLKNGLKRFIKHYQ